MYPAEQCHGWLKTFIKNLWKPQNILHRQQHWLGNSLEPAPSTTNTTVDQKVLQYTTVVAVWYAYGSLRLQPEENMPCNMVMPRTDNHHMMPRIRTWLVPVCPPSPPRRVRSRIWGAAGHEEQKQAFGCCILVRGTEAYITGKKKPENAELRLSQMFMDIFHPAPGFTQSVAQAFRYTVIVKLIEAKTCLLLQGLFWPPLFVSPE